MLEMAKERKHISATGAAVSTYGCIVAVSSKSVVGGVKSYYFAAALDRRVIPATGRLCCVIEHCPGSSGWLGDVALIA